MPAHASQVLIARRYLERGFLDAAMRLFSRNAPEVEPADWEALADALMDRHRIVDVVRVCGLGGVPLPRERLLVAGDALLRRRDVEGAKAIYEIARADIARWSRLVDVLTATPEWERLAVEVASRHLVEAAAVPGVRNAVA